MKWFVVIELPYEGVYIDEFDDEIAAKNEWNERVTTYNADHTQPYPQMIIKGDIVVKFED